MKRIFNFVLLLVALTSSLFAQTSGTLTAGVNLLTSDPTIVRSIQFFDTSGTNNTITLYDNDSASSTNRVRAAYTTTTQYTTNVVMTFTNFTGVVQSYTNAVLARVNSTVAASTNEARRVFRIVVPANGTVSVAPTDPYGTTYGAQLLLNGTAIYNGDFGPIP
jgi:hypothetical protein